MSIISNRQRQDFERASFIRGPELQQREQASRGVKSSGMI
jgi:hypothetical protein